MHRQPFELAREIALLRFGEVKHAAEHPARSSRLFAAGLSLYRRGLVPGFFAAPLGERYFRRLLAPLAGPK